MSIKRINQFPDGSGTLTNDDVFLIMDNPSGSGLTKTLSLSSLYGNISSGVIATIVDFAPATLNTLNEIAAAIGDNENFLNIVAYSGDNITKFVNNANYSVSGHTHTSSNITDFNSSVSGLLPVKNISSGSGILVSSLSGVYTIGISGGGGISSNITGITGASVISNIVSISQANYDALSTKDPNTLYVIV